MTGILSTIFGRVEENKKLEGQAERLDELHGLLEKGCEEIDILKAKLVTRANGALYPSLSNPTLVKPKR